MPISTHFRIPFSIYRYTLKSSHSQKDCVTNCQRWSDVKSDNARNLIRVEECEKNRLIHTLVDRKSRSFDA